jgi:hypothetical protein
MVHPGARVPSTAVHQCMPPRHMFHICLQACAGGSHSAVGTGNQPLQMSVCAADHALCGLPCHCCNCQQELIKLAEPYERDHAPLIVLAHPLVSWEATLLLIAHASHGCSHERLAWRGVVYSGDADLTIATGLWSKLTSTTRACLRVVADAVSTALIS